jgi:toxin-antitoxin system PIN domain toxin
LTRAASQRVWLLDANLLIALTHASHVHHGEAHAWFEQVGKRRWASCALTQLAFVRLTSNPRVVGDTISPAQAMEALASMTAHALHEYWGDAPEPQQLPTLNSAAVVGHRQVTDAYLLGLAVLRGQCLATLDRGLLTFAQASDLAAHIELVSARQLVQEPAERYRVARKARSG